MKHSYHLFAVRVVSFVLAAFMLLPVASATKRPLTAEEALNIKTVSSAMLSPDGHWVVYSVDSRVSAKPDQHDRINHLWLVSTTDPTGDGAPRQITFGEHGESSFPIWSPDGQYISFTATRGDAGAKSQIYLMRLQGGGEAWALTDAKEGVAGAFTWSRDGRQIAYSSSDPMPKELADRLKRKDDAQIVDEETRPNIQIWVVDVATRKASQITSSPDLTARSRPVWSPDGTRIAFVGAPTSRIREDRARIYLVTLATKQIKQLTTDDGSEGEPSWSPDSTTISYGFRPPLEKPSIEGSTVYQAAHLMLYDVASGRTRRGAKALDLSYGGGIWMPDSRHILFELGDRVYHNIFEYDVASDQIRPLTEKRYITLGGMSRDGSHIAFTLASPTAPLDVYVSDTGFRSLRKLADSNPQVADWAFGEPEVITWKSTDGLSIEGILIKPANYVPGRRYPLLTEIHGGPTDAHTAGFHAERQYWAGRGWAVLLPNPRGGSNYGANFQNAGASDYGGGDYRDIMAGIDAVIARGIADPDKLAVTGWSYGGFMTCWMVTQTHRFKAAMMGAGISNLLSFYGTTDAPAGMMMNGPPSAANLQLYINHSGLTYADQVTTPLLMLQGANDKRVPVGQMMEFYRALKDHGKTVQLVFYPREGHGPTEWYHQIDRITRTYNWISKYTLGTSPQEP